MSDRLEKHLEAKCVKAARKLDWLAYKFVSPSHRAVPDRMFIRRSRTQRTHNPSRVWWCEFKKPGERPTKLQEHEIEEMRAEGCDVIWCDSYEQFMVELEARTT